MLGEATMEHKEDMQGAERRSKLDETMLAGSNEEEREAIERSEEANEM